MIADQPFAMVLTTAPGPDRKKTPTIYQYRMVYRDPTAQSACRVLWEVTGGRTPYQIAVERVAGGDVAWHCTCPDAVYRGEKSANHHCKHVRALIDCALASPAASSSN
jgi:hypothetical protein